MRGTIKIAVHYQSVQQMVAGADIQFERVADLAHCKPLRMLGNKTQHPQGALHRLQYIALFIRSKRTVPLDMNLARHRTLPSYMHAYHMKTEKFYIKEYRSYGKYIFQITKIQGYIFSI